MWVFADVPHLMKLLRTHVVDEKGGMVVPRAREENGQSDVFTIISRQCFVDLLDRTAGELRVAHKLKRIHIEVWIFLFIFYTRPTQRFFPNADVTFF